MRCIISIMLITLRTLIECTAAYLVWRRSYQVNLAGNGHRVWIGKATVNVNGALMPLKTSGLSQ